VRTDRGRAQPVVEEIVAAALARARSGG
jgi:hypothetical protein